MGQLGKGQHAGVHSKSKHQEDIKIMTTTLVDEMKACETLNGRKRLEEKKYRSFMHKEKMRTMKKWLKRTCKEVVII